MALDIAQLLAFAVKNHASDLHLGNVLPHSVIEALAQALDPSVHFLVLTGDLTASSLREDFAWLTQALAGVTVPLVPVAGNHDWHDGGVEYRSRFGPSLYAFDHAGARWVVLDMNQPEDLQLAFARHELASWPRERTPTRFANRGACRTFRISRRSPSS